MYSLLNTAVLQYYWNHSWILCCIKVSQLVRELDKGRDSLSIKGTLDSILKRLDNIDIKIYKPILSAINTLP